MLFNKLPQGSLGTGRRHALHLCGCSSVGRARPRHGRGHEFETRHPLHFGCVHALRGHATWCWWSGMCAVLGQATCSETPHPTGCSRLGTAEVDSRPRSSAARAAALSAAGRAFDSSPGAPPAMSRSSRRPRTPGFQSGNAGSNPARDARTTRSPVELTLRGGNRPQRLGGAGTRDRMDFSGAPHSVEQPPTHAAGWTFERCHLTKTQRLVNSVARVPACLVGSRGFDSRTRRQRSWPR